MLGDLDVPTDKVAADARMKLEEALSHQDVVFSLLEQVIRDD